MSKVQLQTNNEKYNQLIELLRGKAVGGGSFNIDDITHTVWQFNEVLNYTGVSVIYNINFYYYTHMGVRMNCNQLQLIMESDGLCMHYYEYATGGYRRRTVYSDNAWYGTALETPSFQKIYFTSNTEDAEFLSWLVENATLVGGASAESSADGGVQTVEPSGFLSSTAEGTVYYSIPSMDDSTLLVAIQSSLSYFSFTKTYRLAMTDPMPIGSLLVIITTGTVTLPNISGGAFNLITSGTGYYIYSINSL